MNKAELLQEFSGTKNVKIKFFKKSPFQKRRYKPEYVEAEAWIYLPGLPSGYCITENDFNNIDYRKEYFDMIKAEASNAT